MGNLYNGQPHAANEWPGYEFSEFVSFMYVLIIFLLSLLVDSLFVTINIQTYFEPY